MTNSFPPPLRFHPETAYLGEEEPQNHNYYAQDLQEGHGFLQKKERDDSSDDRDQVAKYISPGGSQLPDTYGNQYKTNARTKNPKLAYCQEALPGHQTKIE